MKASKALCCSRNPVYGVSVGQENRLDVTNPHTERFFLKFEKSPRCGGLVQAILLLIVAVTSILTNKTASFRIGTERNRNV